MSIKKVGSWGGALSIRLTTELNELNIKEGDEIITKVENGKVIIKKNVPSFNANGVKFNIKE